MPRLFVAIELPQSVKDQLSSLKTSLPTARWVTSEQMHLTLRFIGADVPQSQLEPIIEMLQQIDAPAFPLTLERTGRFPMNNRRAPGVLWVGIRHQSKVKQLAEQIESGLVGLGFEAEKRDFSPHITLARFKLRKPDQAVDSFLDRHKHFKAETFTANEFVLFSSTLTPQGAVYEDLARFELEE